MLHSTHSIGSTHTTLLKMKTKNSRFEVIRVMIAMRTGGYSGFVARRSGRGWKTTGPGFDREFWGLRGPTARMNDVRGPRSIVFGRSRRMLTGRFPARNHWIGPILARSDDVVLLKKILINIYFKAVLH